MIAPTTPATNPTKSLTKPVDAKLVQAYTRFGFKLFSELVEQDVGTNVFISPSSISIALAMTYNGAAGTTKPAIAKALEIQGMSRDELNQANAALKVSLENPDPQVELSIANSLWARKDIPFKPDFMKRNQDFYQAEVATLDFKDPHAPDLINAWVSKQTHGKIEKIVDNMGDLVLWLINAIYFKGKWTDPFEKKQTRDRPFTLLSGTQKQWPMMDRHGEFAYYEGETFQAVSLPYGKGRRFSMYVFLPAKNSSLEAFQKGLAAERWEQWMSQFRSREGEVVLPRFRLGYKTQEPLMNALSSLGMGIAFSRRAANFDDMSPIRPNLYIEVIIHKTFVEVNEEGTEAAAVTGVGMEVGAARPQQPFQMIVDRPFFCAIRDNQTGIVLFMGSIVEPQ